MFLRIAISEPGRVAFESHDFIAWQLCPDGTARLTRLQSSHLVHYSRP